MAETSIIVLTWNQKDLTIRCLNSLLKQKYKDYEIILVDNGSKDGTADAVKKKFGNKVKIVRLSQNRGFCGGNNEGVKNSSKESKYIMLLNNDTVVPDNLLSETVKSIESNENIGAVTVPVYTPGHEEDMEQILSKNISSTGNIFIDCVSIYIDKAIKNNYFTFFPCGTCFLYRKKIIDLPFDKDYFMYAEELYFGALLRLMGYKIIFCRSTSIVHDNSMVKKTASNKLKRYFTYLGRRNRLLNQLLFFEKKTLLKLFPLWILFNLIETIGDFKNFLPRLKAYFYLVLNFRKIMQKHRKIKKLKILSDNEFLGYLSCKFYDAESFTNPFLRKMVSFINKLSFIYCSLVRLNTIERTSEIRRNEKIILL